MARELIWLTITPHPLSPVFVYGLETNGVRAVFLQVAEPKDPREGWIEARSELFGWRNSQ
jgi:hypothetical protein